MAKVRVYELAKELGVESKELLAHLKQQGEFVRSASSTIGTVRRGSAGAASIDSSRIRYWPSIRAALE